MWGGPVYCIYETLFMLRLHCRHHGHADRPHVAPDLSLQQPLEAGHSDRAGSARGEQEGGLLHQEQVQKHSGQEERHQDLRRPENTSGVSLCRRSEYTIGNFKIDIHGTVSTSMSTIPGSPNLLDTQHLDPPPPYPSPCPDALSGPCPSTRTPPPPPPTSYSPRPPPPA